MRTVLALLLLAQAVAAQTAPRLTRVATLGCEACGGAAEFSTIADVAVTTNGVVFVADRQAPFIRVFTPDGRHLRSFGRSGGGPGEYMSIGMLLPDPGGALSIVDFRSYRVTRVDSAGTYISGVQLGAFPFDATMRGGDVFVLAGRFTPGSHYVIAARDTTRVAFGPFVDFPTREAPREVRSMAMAPDGALAIADGGDEYRIRVYLPDRTYRDVTRDVARKERTPAEIAEIEQRVRSQMGRVLAEARGAGASATPRPAPVSNLKPHMGPMALRYDGLGRLWVSTMRGTDTTTVFDVFNADRSFAGEVVVPAAVTSFRLGGEYLVTAGNDADGIPRVMLWRVEVTR
jgi:hypothetical protein